MKVEEKRKRARIFLRAEADRRKMVEDSEALCAVRFVELALPKIVPGYVFMCREEIFEDGLNMEARVRFLKDRVILEVTEKAMREAYKGYAPSRMTLAHEAGHAVLHRSIMRNRVEGSYRPRGTVEQRRVKVDHVEDRRMEDEAYMYAGALLIPPA